MEDLILVTGCTSVTAWGATAFVNRSEAQEAEISLTVTNKSNGRGIFNWRNARGGVAYHNSQLHTVRFFGCIPLLCTDYSFVVSKEQSTGQMRLHQGFQSKAAFILDQTHPGCSRTPS